MTLPFPVPTWHRDPQKWALSIQQANHDQALAIYGEYSMFVLMWKLADNRAGLVERCSECWLSNEKRAAAYGQSDQARCATCLGTTFEGGIKAKIVRLALWEPNNPESQEPSKRGEVRRDTNSVQSTSDFQLRNDDFVFKADGTRHRVQSVAGPQLRHGFQMPRNDRTPVSFTYGQVIQEDETSVAFDIPPAAEDSEIWDILKLPHPQDFSEIETVNGSLLHLDTDLTDSDYGQSPGGSTGGST